MSSNLCRSQVCKILRDLKINFTLNAKALAWNIQELIASIEQHEKISVIARFNDLRSSILGKKTITCNVFV